MLLSGSHLSALCVKARCGMIPYPFILDEAKGNVEQQLEDAAAAAAAAASPIRVSKRMS
jgi:hypothetical protein